MTMIELILMVLMAIGCFMGGAMFIYICVLIALSLRDTCRNYRHYGKRRRR